VLLLTAFVNLVPTERQRFGGFSYAFFVAVQPPGFLGLLTVAAPLLAVLVVTTLGDPTPRARPITMVAMVALAITIFFGLVVEMLIGFIGTVAELSFVDGVKSVLPDVAALGLALLALLVVFRIWQGMFYVPRPTPVAQQAGAGTATRHRTGSPATRRDSTDSSRTMDSRNRAASTAGPDTPSSTGSRPATRREAARPRGSTASTPPGRTSRRPAPPARRGPTRPSHPARPDTCTGSRRPIRSGPASCRRPAVPAARRVGRPQATRTTPVRSAARRRSGSGLRCQVWHVID
jgi:hypothetical protein